MAVGHGPWLPAEMAMSEASPNVARQDKFTTPANLRIAPTNNGHIPRPTLAQLAAAGFTADKLRAWGVRSRRDGVYIPYRYRNGHYARPHLRRLLADVEGQTRFVWTGNAESEFIPHGRWLIPKWLKTESMAAHRTIVAGESDCWTLWKYGLAALGISGISMVKILGRWAVRISSTSTPCCSSGAQAIWSGCYPGHGLAWAAQGIYPAIEHGASTRSLSEIHRRRRS
jgi:hypothetical protein